MSQNFAGVGLSDSWSKARVESFRLQCADTTSRAICGSVCLIALIAGISPQRISEELSKSACSGARRLRTAAGLSWFEGSPRR
jgi:hypothetical protein